MLKLPNRDFGTKTPSQLFNKFYDVGSEMLMALRNQVTSPENRKKPRSWAVGQATKIVGVSRPTFNKLTKSNPHIPGIIEEKIETKSGNFRKVKRFSLEAINHLRDLAGTRYVRPEDSQPLTIAVSNLKGGVGKTETAVDLGKKIAMEGLKCLLLDFDAQGTATFISSGLVPDMELGYEDTITDILIKDTDSIDKVVLNTNFHGLDLIPANLAIQDCDLTLPKEQDNNHEQLGSPFLRLSKALDKIKNNYDVILIDCGPNVGYLTLNAVISCDGMLIPIPPSMSDYSSFIMYTAMLSTMFSNMPQKELLYLRILLTKHNGKKEAVEMENVMRAQFGSYMLTNHMCETVEVPKAANEIGTVYDVAKPRGSKESYQRAMEYLDSVNMEIISNFKEIWEKQSAAKKEELKHEET